MTLTFNSVYLTSAGSFLPGAPVDNDALDQFIVPLDDYSEHIRHRVLEENGIETRHYAIDEQGQTVYSAARMAALAVEDCLRGSGVLLEDVSVMCTGSSGGDLAMPGFANMVQGELAAPPMHTSSHHGVCAASLTALQHAAGALELGAHRHALVVASEVPSRMFKRSRFAPRDYKAAFEAHFLRFMLSDGAGAWLLGRTPRVDGVSLALDWVHTRSFSGDHPVCMQVGSAKKGRHASYLDYSSFGAAEQDGAMFLRQDLRLLPRLFELGVHEYVELVRAERIAPARTDLFLCHYSSKKFEPVVDELMQKAGFAIEKQRWYSNLTWRGNTGAASMPIMLSDLLRERALVPGQRILCFVPESGRFTVSFAHFTVVSPDAEPQRGRRGARALAANAAASDSSPVIAPPHQTEPGAERSALGDLIGELSSVWHGYQTRLWRTPVIRKITQGTFTREDYLRWMSCWIPQVRYGSHWMRRAGERIGEPFLALRPLIAAHARDEQEDYGILFDDYKSAGGTEPDIERLRRNPGGEALNAFMFRLAERPNPVSLLGAVYIIEGTGQRVVPALLPRLRAQLGLPERAFRFLGYHGENDAQHLARWLEASEIVLAQDPSAALAQDIVATARASAELYLLQFQYVL